MNSFRWKIMQQQMNCSIWIYLLIEFNTGANLLVLLMGPWMPAHEYIQLQKKWSRNQMKAVNLTFWWVWKTDLDKINTDIWRNPEIKEVHNSCNDLFWFHSIVKPVKNKMKQTEHKLKARQKIMNIFKQ